MRDEIGSFYARSLGKLHWKVLAARFLINFQSFYKSRFYLAESAVAGLNIKETELTQYLFPVGSGPSSKTWPR
jgi:hypothetical protein